MSAALCTMIEMPARTPKRVTAKEDSPAPKFPNGCPVQVRLSAAFKLLRWHVADGDAPSYKKGDFIRGR